MSLSVSKASAQLFVSNYQVKTTSQNIAEIFSKRHDDILRKIKALDCSEEFTARNFAVSEYGDSTGRKLPMYEITRDGFMILVMGFTGKRAMPIKEAYIEAFNAMEAELLKQQGNPNIAALPGKINTEQQWALQKIVSNSTRNSKDKSKAMAAIWSRFKNKFQLPRYSELSQDKFAQAVAYLSDVGSQDHLRPTLELRKPERDNCQPQKMYKYPMSMMHLEPSGLNNELKVVEGLSMSAENLLARRSCSPIAQMLSEMALDGHDVSGCAAEHKALYHHLSEISNMLNYFEREIPKKIDHYRIFSSAVMH